MLVWRSETAFRIAYYCFVKSGPYSEFWMALNQNSLIPLPSLRACCFSDNYSGLKKSADLSRSYSVSTFLPWIISEAYKRLEVSYLLLQNFELFYEFQMILVNCLLLLSGHFFYLIENIFQSNRYSSLLNWKLFYGVLDLFGCLFHLI